MGPLLYQESDRVTSRSQPGRYYDSGHLLEIERRDRSQRKILHLPSFPLWCDVSQCGSSYQQRKRTTDHIGQPFQTHEKMKSYRTLPKIFLNFII